MCLALGGKIPPHPPPCPCNVYLFARCFLFEQQSEITTASPEETSYVVSIYSPRCEKVFLGTTDFSINSSVPSASGKRLFDRETKFKINFAHTYHGAWSDLSQDLRDVFRFVFSIKSERASFVGLFGKLKFVGISP